MADAKVFAVTRAANPNCPAGLFDNRDAAKEAATGIDVDGADGNVDALPVYSTFSAWLAGADDATRQQHLSRLRMVRDRINTMLGETSIPLEDVGTSAP